MTYSTAELQRLIARVRPRLIDDWWRVLKRAWSIRLMIVAGLLSGLEAALPLFDGYLPIPPGLFALLTLVVVAAAFVARLLAQSSLPDCEDKK